MKKISGIGLMAGTSLDGLDVVFCEFQVDENTVTVEIGAAECIPLGEQWTQRLALLHEQDAETYAKTHVYFGNWMGKTVADFIKRHGLQPDFVASHGQTIFHQPNKSFTSQVGDGETMVAFLPCPLVTNFRNKNVALGGEGAPLVPFGEKYLFPEYELFLNLGGIVNIAWGETGFDICPCNQVLNVLAHAHNDEWAYDPNGEIAASGTIHQPLLEALNQLPFYQEKHPKSLGREWVETHVNPLFAVHKPSIPDMLRTFVEHIAIQIKNSIEALGVTQTAMLVTGGGAHNRFLRERIAAHLAKHQITLPEVSATWIDYKEAIVFAFLGLTALQGKPNTLPRSTGTDFPVLGGAIHLPPGGGFSLL